MSNEEEQAAVASGSDVPPSPAGKTEDTGTAIFKSMLGFAATAANQASQMANKASEEMDKLSLERTGKTMAEHASYAADKAKEAGTKVMSEADKLAVAGTGRTIGENTSMLTDKAKAAGAVVMEKADGLSTQYTGKTVHENISPITTAASTIIDKASYEARALAVGAKYSVDFGPEEKERFDKVREITGSTRPHGTHGCPLSEITPGVFTCHFNDINTPESIPNLGKNIGLVVNSACPHFQNDTFPGYCNTYPGFYGPDVEVCNIDLLDDPKEGETHTYPGDAKQYFRYVNRKITEVLEADKCVLVHCYGSISRSAVLIIAYLMESKGIDLLDATQLMKDKWEATWPNDAFVRQLIEFEKELQKERMSSDV